MSSLKKIDKRKTRVRSKLKSKNRSSQPRIVVFRSNKNFYAQLINISGVVMKSFSSLQLSDSEIKGKKGCDIARIVGSNFAKLCVENGVKEAIFDKGGYLYTGRVRAFADSCREFGMQF